MLGHAGKDCCGNCQSGQKCCSELGDWSWVSSNPVFCIAAFMVAFGVGYFHSQFKLN